MFGTTKKIRVLIAFGAVLALAGPAELAVAKGAPPVTETAGNNLSVPTYFIGVGGPVLRTACTGSLVPPTGVAVDGYYLQKTDAVWSAPCSTQTAAVVTAQWGSNLTNGRALKAGRPIRVEMALNSVDPGLGYAVENLTPELPDRQATYGIPAGDGTGVPVAMTYLVWASGATLTIIKDGTSTPVYAGPMSAEINSTGKVVYGFNWGTAGKVSSAQPGTYALTFTVPAGGATITGYVAGEVDNQTSTETSATVTIVVTSGSSGTGGGRK